MSTILTIDTSRIDTWYRAVEDVGRDVVLIKGNKIVGEGYSSVMSDGVVSIEMRDDRAKALVENAPQVKAWGEKFAEKKYKWARFEFCSFTGVYLDTDDTFCAELEDVRVVDKFNLRYRIVPDTFKDVEGYGAVYDELSKANAETN